jgi:hypothetical protein
LFKTQKPAENSLAVDWYQSTCLLASTSHLFIWRVRTQYCKTESGYNFLRWCVCTEGLVSLRNFSCRVADS